MDKGLVGRDPHFQNGCTFCHRGDEKAGTREGAHQGLVRRPSDDLRICGTCHQEIARNYKNSLHYNTAGLSQGVMPRLSPEEGKAFQQKVFAQSCHSCHSSCGDCHVKKPIISGVNLGLLKGHQFVRKDEGQTCALCHGGRVYPEFTGEYGGTPDVHYQKGMTCLDCHSVSEFHGDGTAYRSRREVKNKPSCLQCHPPGQEKTEKARSAHSTHQDRLSCYTCHSGTPYRNCQNCHAGQGATAKPDFLLGLSPRDRKTITTLRLIPTVRDTFLKAGIRMEAYDRLPNYWDTVPHNIRKRTERTRSCEVCHQEQKDFLTRGKLIPGGSRENEKLIYTPRPLTGRP